MSTAPWIVALSVLIAVGNAHADPETEAQHAFDAAEAHAVTGDVRAIDELEALGAARPVTSWTDDAWSEAGRLAERAGDLARARHDDEQALAVTTDDRMATRLRAALARIAANAGWSGQWATIAAEHIRLESQVQAGGDPKPALGELGKLIDSNPGYPGAARAMVAIARGWQRDGNLDQARAWLERAVRIAGGGDLPHTTAELVRVLVARGDFAEARITIDGVAEPALRGELDALYARAKLRHDLRTVAWCLLVVFAAFSVVAVRRAAGSWRAAARGLMRPPIEAVFIAPIAIVISFVAATGNPLVAHAVRLIALAGVVVTWISGAILELRRGQGKVTWRRALIHAVLAAVCVVAATYLAIERDRTIDLVVETWRNGPERL